MRGLLLLIFIDNSTNKKSASSFIECFFTNKTFEILLILVKVGALVVCDGGVEIDIL